MPNKYRIKLVRTFVRIQYVVVTAEDAVEAGRKAEHGEGEFVREYTKHIDDYKVQELERLM